MRAVVVHDSDVLGRSTRRMVLGAGLECTGEDFVPFEMLEDRLARGDAGVIVVRIGENPLEAVDLAAKAVTLCQSPVFAVGELTDKSLADRLKTAGATHLENDTQMQTQFDEAVDSIVASNGKTHHKGRVYSIFSPTPGSGATSIATNLAAALGNWYPQGVVLVEMGKTSADIPLRLDIQAKVGTNDICRRWEQLDSTSLDAGLTQRKGGLQVLAHTENGAHFDDDPVQPASVRRVGVLMRSHYPCSVWKLDGTIDEECLEALKLSDQILCVIRPDVLCVRRAQAAINLADAHGVDINRILIVVNRWGQPGQLSRKQIESTFGGPIFHTIPDDPKVANRAINRGLLFQEVARGSALTRQIAKLAKKLQA